MPAPRISAPSASMTLSTRAHGSSRCGAARIAHRQHAVDRARAPARRSAGSTITSVVMVSSECRIFGKRDALHVRAEIAGPHEIDVGIFGRDIVAHRAFGDHHHARRVDACRHSRSSPRSTRRNRPPRPLRAGIRDGPERRCRDWPRDRRGYRRRETLMHFAAALPGDDLDRASAWRRSGRDIRPGS